MKNTIDIGVKIDVQELHETKALIQGNSGAGKSNIARVLMEEILGRVPLIVLDKNGEYYTLKEVDGDLLVIGGDYADIPISIPAAAAIARELIANKLSAVIDMSDLKKPLKREYVKNFLEEVNSLNKSLWTAYFFFLEEAHDFAGEQDKYVSADAVKELMSEGRKKGFCGIPITQRIAKLHKDVAAECNNKFIGRTFLDVDIIRSSAELGFSGSKNYHLLQNLKPGEFYAMGTAMNPHHPHRVNIRLAKSKSVKAGSIADIKPQKPTQKIKGLLAKLSEIAEENAEPVKKENVAALNYAPYEQQIAALRKQLTDIEADRKIYFDLSTGYQMIISEISKSINGAMWHQTGDLKLSETGVLPVTNTKPVVKAEKPVVKQQQPARAVNAKILLNTNLSKCAAAILHFLRDHPIKPYKKEQIGVFVGYSPNTGNFSNCLTELSSAGLITRDRGTVVLNNAVEASRVLGNPPKIEYDIRNYRPKLSKCASEIFDILIEDPRGVYTKERLAALTASGYSAGTGNFSNCLTELSSLGIIKRSQGTSKINPDILEFL